jgi:hypothetical protein
VNPFAGQAYEYLTGRPAACIVVAGPGVVHGLAGLANAQQDCRPMILTSGASQTWRAGMGALQEERQLPFLQVPSLEEGVANPITASYPYQRPKLYRLPPPRTASPGGPFRGSRGD